MPRHVKQKKVKVQRVPVESAHLIEIGPDHRYWNGDRHTIESRKGSIVKLVPPPGTSEATVLAIERSFYEAGAASVKVMPAQEEVRVVVEGEEFDFTEHNDERSLRQVVMERASRVTTTHDQVALEKLLIKAMDHAEGQA